MAYGGILGRPHMLHYVGRIGKTCQQADVTTQAPADAWSRASFCTPRYSKVTGHDEGITRHP
jgi:hypothetical protein